MLGSGLGGNVAAQARAGHGQAHRIALPQEEVPEGRTQARGVAQLRDLARRKAHGARSIEEEQRSNVGLVLVLLQVKTIGLPEGAPVDVPDLISGDIRAMLGELDRGSLRSAEVKP